MEFIAPLMLVGLAGVSIPIVVHLIGRRRARVVRFAAIDFLLGSDRKLARRLRLRELLLLMARALICAAIPLVLARPFTSCAAGGPSVTRGPQAAVIVIDNSVVSQYRLDGETLLARAKRRAGDILAELGPAAEVAIVPAAAGAKIPAGLSPDPASMRETLSALTASDRPPDTSGALAQAAALLRRSKQRRRTIYLVSPLTKSGLGGGDLGSGRALSGGGIALAVVDVAPAADLDNVAVVGLAVSTSPGAGPRGISVVATIANFGSRPVKRAEVTLAVGGKTVAKGFVSLRPGEHKRKRFATTIPHGTRSARVVVRTPRDALSADDRRYALAELPDQVRALLVDGDPHTVRYRDELFYLTAALRPGDRADSRTIVSVAAPDELDATRLDDFDVVVLANVRALSTPQVARLARWVKAGGGLFVTCGERVDPDAYNASMAPLLPQRMQSVLDVGYGHDAGAAHVLHLAKLALNAPILSGFSDHPPELVDAKYKKIILLDPSAETKGRHVIARYDDGAAALVEAADGKGRLLLYTSTVDRDWNDLPIYPGYLPLMQQSIRYLARKQSREAPRQVLIGRAVPITVPAGATRIEVRAPDGTRAVFEGDQLAGRRRIRYRKTATPGVYRVFAAVGRETPAPRPNADFAVDIDPRASDLSRADVPSLRASAAGRAPSGTHRRRVDLWHGIAVALLAFLLLESLLVLRS